MNEHSLFTKRVLICVGPGGVGKTTVAAALGVAAARQRRRAAVITVDPARRLKDALGLVQLSTDPFPIRLSHQQNGKARRGTLHAFALDAKHTFDSLVQRFAPSPQ